MDFLKRNARMQINHSKLSFLMKQVVTENVSLNLLKKEAQMQIVSKLSFRMKEVVTENVSLIFLHKSTIKIVVRRNSPNMKLMAIYALLL